MAMSPLPVDLPPTVDVLGLPLRPLRTDSLIELLAQRACAGQRTTACYANAHIVNMAMKDAEFHRALESSDVLYADGASVVWASRWARMRLPERMTAADYFPRFIQRCGELGLRVFLLGGKNQVAEEAARRLCSEFPGIQIVGTHNGYFADGESIRVIEQINAARPDVLAVGLSSPRQEKWLATYGNSINAPVRWCVGALFDYFAGLERRAPQWLCRIGGEWAFRLLMDPVGKWRRYVIGNPLFVWHTLRWGMGKRPVASAPPGKLGLTRG